MIRARKSRRGLSPLIAAVVLISATIVGGMLVYQYFQSSLGRAQAMAQGLAVTASSMPLNSNTTLIEVSILNNYNKPVTITGVTGILANASTVTLKPASGQELPVQLNPGEKNTIILVSNQTVPRAVVVHYSVDGVEHQSDPVQLG
ncbi:MAG: hypothetical protein LRS48_03430 [Desulfurococcales archaeon]|nr:hypothetical protein [Desulfurococcales archaeon]